MGNNASPQVFANLSRVITSWLPAIAKTMKQRYNRVSSYLDAIARAAARLVDCGDEGAGGWWWRRRRRITTEGCAVKGKRQTGGRHPVLIPIPDPTPLGHTLNGQPLLEFPMSSGEPALEPLRIKRATLWTRVELKHAHRYQHHRHNQINQRNITLWVFKVHCGNTTHLRGKELGQHLEMVTSLVVNVGQLGWQKFDVTKVVSRWYTNYSKDKLTLLVDCSGCGSHVHVSTFDGYSPHVIESSLNSKGDQDPDRPFLVMRTDPAAMKRVRRRAIECNDTVKGQCCKQRFYVNFSQLGWDDWIIAPAGYYANYCKGDCAAGHRTPDTFLNYYTHVIEEYRKMDRLAGMQPCCAPLKFSPMSLIYYGPDSNIIKRDLPKMVVDECGCP
ncbi:hypothetical protein ACFW04_001697 [Cataglyphis niger]